MKNNLRNSLKGTPLKRKRKHCQSANDCDCYKESPDTNIERNYILSLLTKSLHSQTDGKNKISSNSLKDKKEKNNKNGKDMKNAIKRVTSITLRRNRIINLNDGSGGRVLVSQTTTFKGVPENKDNKESIKKQDDSKKKFNILKPFLTVKKKAQEFIKRKKPEDKTKVDDKASEEIVIKKPIAEFETVPSQDDYIEETFTDEGEEVKDVKAQCDGGRESVCSGYYTPLDQTPQVSRRVVKRRATECELVTHPDTSDSDSVDSECQVTVPVESITRTLDAAGPTVQEEVRRRQLAGKPLYPNCDNSVWMRSCEKEIPEPITGTSTGMIPVWLKGTLLRNGPGSMQVGDMTFQHLFDSSALLHRFAISNGSVTYQCRFLRTNTYVKNHTANRIVINEFGTKAVPDPCQSIFKRVSALFNPGESLSDNAMISVYPFGDEYYCFTESPAIHRIDPTTLETLERVNLSKHVAVVNHTSHPHVMPDGTVYNQAMSLQGTSPHYSIVQFPKQNEKNREKRPNQMFEKAEVVASVKARWPLYPSYMHTFGLTELYYVIVEQPLSVSVPTMVKNQLFSQPMCSCFRFFKDKHTLIHVVERSSGKIFRTYLAEAFFYLHIVNQFEISDHLVIDICCYSDPAMLDCMYYDSMKDMSKNPDYARLFRGRPLRFVLPLVPPIADGNTNLVSLAGSGAKAWWRDGQVFVAPELLCDLGCETPRINYNRHLGRPYRYFYAISSDVDLHNPGTLIKVDTHFHSTKTWSEPRVFPSEPIFVPSPYPQGEDDGVILSALVWGRGQETQVGLLVLDAASWTELGRTVFQTPSPVPKCLHGWFTSDF